MRNQIEKSNKFTSLFAVIVIPIIIAICLLLFFYVLGDPSNFEGRNPLQGHPLNLLGIVYKGGIVVPFLMSCFVIVVTFSVERFLTIGKAYGQGGIDKFLRDIKKLLVANDMPAAMERCRKQQGSVGNVVYSVIHKYQEQLKDPNTPKEQKAAFIQKEIEEATALEMPILEKNLTIIATLASVATLIGLLGTVIGMIKAFSALATAGSPDAVALANGISEALINTALGIAASALAIVSYNYFTSKIDTLTYGIDEMGFSIVSHFNSSYQDKSAGRKQVIEFASN
jgi:biopolymer transport protein ExbB